MQNFPTETLQAIKKHLEEERQRLVTRISEMAKQDPFSDPDRVVDNAASDAEANEESNHDRYSALGDELKIELANAEAALVRIEKGTYGFCENCGNMIDTDRLAILPTAKLCRTCEEQKNHPN